MRRSRLALVLPLAFIGVVVPTTSASAAPPSNDVFADATSITLDFTEVVDTTEATTGEAEDLAAKDACGSPPFDSPAPPDATVWYSLSVDETLRVLISAAPPMFVTPGFNVVVDNGDGFDCVAGGPVEVSFIAEAGVTYYIQSIDDQIPPGPDAPLDTVNGGILNFSATSLGAPLPEVCPGIAPDDPNIPPGLNLIIGTDDGERIRGTAGDDLIFGLGGNDVINGRGGNDVIFGCDGDDLIRGGPGDDFIFGDSADFFGNPTSTSGGNDDIRGGSGNDEVRGGPGDDHIHGGSGDDALFGNQGNDDMEGNGGEDFMGGGFGDDDVSGGGGDDFVSGGFGNDDLTGNGGDDFITGDLPNGMEDTDPNVDHCDGGGGTNEIVFCEGDEEH